MQNTLIYGEFVAARRPKLKLINRFFKMIAIYVEKFEYSRKNRIAKRNLTNLHYVVWFTLNML